MSFAWALELVDLPPLGGSEEKELTEGGSVPELDPQKQLM